jgi:hypothetical protein
MNKTLLEPINYAQHLFIMNASLVAASLPSLNQPSCKTALNCPQVRTSFLNILLVIDQ